MLRYSSNYPKNFTVVSPDILHIAMNSLAIRRRVLPPPPKSPTPSSTGADYRDGEYGEINSLRTSSIFSSLSSLFLSAKFSDMTIRCGERDIKTHRAVVCPQSSFFDKAMTGGFMVSKDIILEKIRT